MSWEQTTLRVEPMSSSAISRLIPGSLEVMPSDLEVLSSVQSVYGCQAIVLKAGFSSKLCSNCGSHYILNFL